MKFRLDDWVSVGTMCLIMGLLYMVAFGKYGYSDTDHGFIQGLSWRILQGEAPYTDFTYVRPPLSIYLHSIPLTFSQPIWSERLIFYLFMAITVWVCTRTLQIYFDFQAIGISPALFAIMAFILSVHNYPPMPWHTVDGLLFASIGIYSLVVGKPMFKALIGLQFLLFAALCKQAFYPLIFFGPILLTILHGRRFAFKIFGIFAGINLIAFLGLAYINPDYVHSFIQQTSGAATLKDLWEIGIIKYAKPFFLIVLPIIILWRIQNRFIFPGHWKFTPAAICWIIFLGLLMLHVIKAIQTNEYIAPSFGMSQAMFLLAVGIGIKGTWINTKAHSVLLMLLVTAWCSSLSWGYRTPMLFFTPMLFGFIFGLYDEFEFRVPRYFYGMICLILAWAFTLLNQYPYRDVPKSEISFHLGDIFPTLKNIYGGEPIYMKLAELNDLYHKYGDTYTVLPSLPSAHLFTQSQNPFPVDWAHNAEMQYADHKDGLFQSVLEEIDVIFIEKDKLDRIEEDGKYGSMISSYVRQYGTLIEELAFFEVYMFDSQRKGPLYENTQTGPAPASY